MTSANSRASAFWRRVIILSRSTTNWRESMDVFKLTSRLLSIFKFSARPRAVAFPTQARIFTRHRSPCPATTVARREIFIGPEMDLVTHLATTATDVIIITAQMVTGARTTTAPRWVLRDALITTTKEFILDTTQSLNRKPN